MYRLSKRTIGNGFLTLIWIICAFIDIHHGENYGGIIYKFFASAVFLVVTIHNLLIDFGKVKPIEKKKEKWYALITIVVIIVATVIILGNYDVETYKYNIKSEKIPESFDGFRCLRRTGRCPAPAKGSFEKRPFGNPKPFKNL